VDTYQAVQNSIELLQRMSENPKAVLEALDPAGRNRVMTELSLLAEHSAGVEDEADLLYVTDALHRLPKETPALAKLLFPRNEEVTSPQERRTTRTITIDDIKVAYDKNLYAQEHAAEIHNHVVRCRKVLQQSLLDPPRGVDDDDR
jgi:hypothetical protein